MIDITWLIDVGQIPNPKPILTTLVALDLHLWVSFIIAVASAGVASIVARFIGSLSFVGGTNIFGICI